MSQLELERRDPQRVAAVSKLNQTTISIVFLQQDTLLYQEMMHKLLVVVNYNQCTIGWNQYQEFKDLLTIHDYPVKEDEYIAVWEKKDFSPSNDSMMMVRNGTYTCILSLNRGQIVGYEHVKKAGFAFKFEEIFDQVYFHKDDGRPGKKSFGLKRSCPATAENLNAIFDTDQMDCIKQEAFEMLWDLRYRRRVIVETILQRMSTAEMPGKLHRRVVTSRTNPMSPMHKLLKDVPEIEVWKEYLNAYEPYSQQKIAAQAAYLVRYIPWWIDMRVGKTAPAMMVAKRTLKEGTVSKWVVIAPSLNTYNPWFKELEKQYSFDICMLNDGLKNDCANIAAEEHDVYIVSYASLGNRLEVMQAEWDMQDVGVIIDETSLIKNPASKRTKAVHMLTEHVAYVIELNGTPMAQGAADLWAQQFAIDRGQTFGVSYGSFAHKWMKVDFNGRHTLRDETALEFEMEIASTSIRYIRSEADQFRGKDKGFRYIGVPPTTDIKRGTREITDGVVKNADGDFQLIKENILTVYGHLRECCAGYGKYEAIEESSVYERRRHKIDPKITWIKTFLKSNPGQPMVIFSEFSESEDRIMEMLEAEGVSYSSARPHKGKPYKGMDRSRQIDRFQEGDVRVFLMKSVQAKGVTLNRLDAVKKGLSGFPVIIYAQPTWSLIDWEQSQDRCVGTIPEGMHNAGKSIFTPIYALVVVGSIEEKIVAALRGKKKVAESLLADAKRSGYSNPFEDMDFSSEDGGELDEIFDSEEMESRYQLKLSPQKKLSEKMILDADAKYKSAKYKSTQKAARLTPPSSWATILLSKGGFR